MTGLQRVVLHPRHPKGVSEALRSVDGIELVEPDEEEFVAALAGTKVLITYAWDPEWVDRTPVRWVQSVSAGYDQFDLDELADRSIALTTARGVHGPQVSEHVIALLLAMTRGVGISMREAERRNWRPRSAVEVAGRTLAVLGLGSIGEQVAAKARALGLRVVGTKRSPDGYAGVAEQVWGPDGTVEACRQADIVVSALPGGVDTDRVVGSAELAALGAGWYINVGRGNAVDEDALRAALDEGELRGAGLDVFSTEPLPEESWMWSHPRVVMTPHMAGFSPEYGRRLAGIFAANLVAFEGAGEWVNRVV